MSLDHGEGFVFYSAQFREVRIFLFAQNDEFAYFFAK